jgi:hypothetical protein
MRTNNNVKLNKPLWWKILLVLLGTLYLIPEAIFNSQLVSLLGLGTPSKEDLEQLELFGRSVSGIGVTLLFADLLKVKYVNTIPKAILSFILLLAIIWPTVFYGQKFIIEKFIIETSTAEQRQQAIYSSVLRDALAIDTIKINSVNYDSKYLDSPENLTFLALFGGLSYADKNLANSLEESKNDIIYKFIQQRAYNDFEKHYSEYSALYDELSKNYNSYADGSHKYNDTILNIPQRESEYWIDIENGVNSGYTDYKAAQKSHIAKASARAQEYGGGIFTYFENIGKCRERYKKSKYAKRLSQCLEKQNIEYRKNILNLGIGFIEPNYWLIPIKISTSQNLFTTIVGGVLTGGLYTGLQAIDAMSGGDGGFKDVRYEYTSDPDHYQRAILRLPTYNELFLKETGYPFTITDLEIFRQHELTSKKLVAKFKTKKLNLNKDWHISKRDDFYDAVDKKVRMDALRSWNNEMRQRGFTINPNLNWDDFQLHPEVQKKIQEKMKDNYVKNIRADWNKKNFKINVVDVNIRKKTDEYLQAIQSSLIHFEDGGKYAEYGKQALRSVIVPPISMFLSLFLICLTLAKLPSKYYGLFNNKEIHIKNKEIHIKNKEIHIKNKALNIILNIIKKVYMPILILTIPVIFISNIYTEDKNNTVNYFLNKVEESANPAISYIIKWTIHTQPILHPLGNTFEDITHIYNNFDKVSYILHDIDINIGRNEVKKPANNVVFGEINDSFLNELIQNGDEVQLNKYLASINKGILYIEAPKGSLIQIMNIKPKYKSGIMLDVGQYDIKVTYPNKIVKRNWYNINAIKNIIQI